MFLQPFIYHFGGGKIQLKYRIIEEKYSKPKRLLIESTLLLLMILQIAAGVALFDTRFGLFWTCLIIVAPIIVEYRIFRIINRSNQKGTIFFNEDHLIISKDDDIKILYRDIANIYFKTHLNTAHNNSRRANSRHFHSYILQINSNGKSYVVKVENDMFVTEEDKLHFNRVYPLLITTLEEIYQRYRIWIEEKPRKFKFEEVN